MPNPFRPKLATERHRLPGEGADERQVLPTCSRCAIFSLKFKVTEASKYTGSISSLRCASRALFRSSEFFPEFLPKLLPNYLKRGMEL